MAASSETDLAAILRAPLLKGLGEPYIARCTTSSSTPSAPRPAPRKRTCFLALMAQAFDEKEARLRAWQARLERCERMMAEIRAEMREIEVLEERRRWERKMRENRERWRGYCTVSVPRKSRG